MGCDSCVGNRGQGRPFSTTGGAEGEQPPGGWGSLSGTLRGFSGTLVAAPWHGWVVLPSQVALSPGFVLGTLQTLMGSTATHPRAGLCPADVPAYPLVVPGGLCAVCGVHVLQPTWSRPAQSVSVGKAALGL